MTLEDLLRRFRTLAKDKVEPYRAEDDDVLDWLNDAHTQACVRGRLLVAEGEPALSQIALQPGQVAYPLHRAIYEIISLRIVDSTGQVRSITLKTREWLDAELHDWRDYPRPACFAIQTDTGLRVVGAIEAGDVLHLEAYRLPLKKLAIETDKPEIHEAHHEHLIQWALHKAFSVPDSELFDAARAGLAEQAFTAYFGLLPDADMRRTTREDVAHHNRGYLL
ncbi:DUF6682 family protein [Delftia acidovorans]|uniref:phage adaptor protein n=1 Tax=Delftia acidovorans TaxID=80866 RepID=UPI00192BA95C|nr:DUF6682 family protein [Delftia acidovorans]